MPVTELNHYFVRGDQGLLLRRARLRGHAPAVLPGPGLLARRERQDPGAHGARRHRQRRPLLPGHAEGRRHRPRRGGGPHRVRGLEYQPRSLPEFDLYQIFVKDPNGLTIELNVFGLKDVKDWGGEDYSKMPQTAGARA